MPQLNGGARRHRTEGETKPPWMMNLKIALSCKSPTRLSPMTASERTPSRSCRSSPHKAAHHTDAWPSGRMRSIGRPCATSLDSIRCSTNRPSPSGARTAWWSLRSNRPRPSRTTVHSAPDRALVVVDDPPSPPTSAPPTATAAHAASRPAAATTSTPKTSVLPNGRKGYKLTLVVSATSEAGLADAHGMLQLDGADPVPFCRLKNVQNPLARALQDAHLAIQRARAKPPKMAAPSVPAAPAPVARQRPVPPPRPAPRPQESPSRPAAASARPAGPPATPKQAAPVDQPALF